LLAARGATVVVNDIDAEPGVTDTNDAASPDGARALIDGAIEQHGRIDILINNAGIMEWSAFADADDDLLDRHLAVHLGGSVNTTRAAWPHMVGQGYGRILMTTSTGVLGLRGNFAYAAAKGAVIALTRTLAVEGAKAGIKVNAIAPAAKTRMAGDEASDMPPELVAPMAAYLVHEDCPVGGEIYTAGAGRFARLFLGSTAGAVVEDTPTIESVAENWAAINDDRDYYVPTDLMDWSTQFLAHLPPAPS
jgi:NAD(P)-dependent dehydrogenase (short-subunit alcohol dehydrogenase family)